MIFSQPCRTLFLGSTNICNSLYSYCCFVRTGAFRTNSINTSVVNYIVLRGVINAVLSYGTTANKPTHKSLCKERAKTAFYYYYYYFLVFIF